jgi:microcystin-dependent protein
VATQVILNQPAFFTEGKAYPYRNLRTLVEALAPGIGASQAGHLVPSRNSTANLRVSIAPGYFIVRSRYSSSDPQGVYVVVVGSAQLLDHNPAVTFPRIDQIVVGVTESAEQGGTGTTQPELRIVQGTESSGTTLDTRAGATTAAASFPPSWELVADVLVRPGQPLRDQDIRDRRTLAKTAIPSAWFPGDVRFSTRTVPFAGWLTISGGTLSVPRATYPDLWSAAQAEIAASNPIYGPGDGATTFTITNLANRTIVGASTGGGGAEAGLTTRSVGTKWGVNAVMLGPQHIPPLAHSHAMPANAAAYIADVGSNASASIAPFGTFTRGVNAFGPPQTANANTYSGQQLAASIEQPSIALTMYVKT